MVIPLILFMLVGFGLGFALSLPGGFLALLVPILFAALTVFTKGIDGHLIVVLIVALALTAVSVIIGALLAGVLERRGAEV